VRFELANLGFIGLGVMGGGIAKRLLDAGHTVTGYNRTRSRCQWLLDAGMRWADSPRSVAAATDVVFSMVSDAAALKAVAEGPEGLLAGLRPGAVWADMSTSSPLLSQELAERAAALGAAKLEAPVSGSVSTVQEGRLSVMVGGDRAAFERVEPILRDIGPRVTYVGPSGQALLLKLAANLSVAVQTLAFSEGVALAEKGGVPRETAVRVLLESVIASPMLHYRGPFVLQLPDEAWFNVNMMQKDLLLALEAGRRLEVPLPTCAATNEMLTAARGMGLGAQEFACLFHVLARMAGLEGDRA
jgi:3-hydroxyisobutyrate dehydrogenase-like beta-hydroxyacid dehydrogenase